MDRSRSEAVHGRVVPLELRGDAPRDFTRNFCEVTFDKLEAHCRCRYNSVRFRVHHSLLSQGYLHLPTDFHQMRHSRQQSTAK